MRRFKFYDSRKYIPLNSGNIFYAKRYLTPVEIFGLIAVFTTSNILSLVFIKNIIERTPKSMNNNMLKNIKTNNNKYVVDEKIKNNIDDILFFCDNKIKNKINKYEKEIKLENINTKNYILLYGPPGCGKTHLASHLVGETGKNLVSVNLSELKSPWVGDEASKLNSVLKSVDNCINSIIIFDEIDTIVTHRKYDSVGAKEASASINILLAWMDGINTDNNDKIILFTTNKPNELSSAFLDRITYKINLDYISKDQAKEYWKHHLSYLNNQELNELSNIPLKSFRMANNILKHVVLNKIKNSSETKITIEEIIEAYIIINSK